MLTAPAARAHLLALVSDVVDALGDDAWELYVLYPWAFQDLGPDAPEHLVGSDPLRSSTEKGVQDACTDGRGRGAGG